MAKGDYILEGIMEFFQSIGQLLLETGALLLFILMLGGLPLLGVILGALLVLIVVLKFMMGEE